MGKRGGKEKPVEIFKLAKKIEKQFGDGNFTYENILAKIIEFLAENKNAGKSEIFNDVTNGRGKIKTETRRRERTLAKNSSTNKTPNFD